MSELRAETTAAASAVRVALRMAARGPREVRSKGDLDIVTDADVAIEDYLRGALGDAAPHPVIGEERGGSAPAQGAYWLVDPVCGTTNYASRIPLFAINVALVEEGKVTASVVGDGSSGRLLAAEAGRGAWHLDDRRLDPLRASTETMLVDFGAWPGPADERRRSAHIAASAIGSGRWNVRCFSSTLCFAYVASGQMAGYVLFTAPDVMHTAAGALLAAEAGAVLTDTEGRPWDLDSRSFVAAGSAQLHAELLALFG